MNFDKHFDRLVQVERNARRPITFTGDIHFYPDNLYKVLYDECSKVYTFPCCADFLDPALPMKVILEHIDVMRRARQHVFVITIRQADRLRDVNDWVLAKYRVWPHNIFIGVEVFGRYDLERISKLGRTGADLKWVDLSRWVPDQEYETRILLGNDVGKLFNKSGIGWVYLGPRIGEPQNLGGIANDDLCHLLTQAKDAGCRVYLNQLQALKEQVRSYLAWYRAELTDGTLQIDDLQQVPVFPKARAADVSDFEPAFIPGECYRY